MKLMNNLWVSVTFLNFIEKLEIAQSTFIGNLKDKSKRLVHIKVNVFVVWHVA